MHIRHCIYNSRESATSIKGAQYACTSTTALVATTRATMVVWRSNCQVPQTMVLDCVEVEIDSTWLFERP